jgi:beta-phosphoglucomutase
MNNHYQAILFDFDGVLVDSEPIHYECWMEVLSPHGFRLDWESYARDWIGVSDSSMIRRFCETATPPLDFEKVWGEYPRKTEIFRERMAEREVFHPETLRLLEALDRYKLGVVSSSARTEVEPPLVRAGIRDRFGALVCGRELVPNLKPAPDPYRKAAELLGVTRALVIEDSDAGEKSGRAAGFDVLRLAHPSRLADELSAALGLPAGPASLLP